MVRVGKNLGTGVGKNLGTGVGKDSSTRVGKDSGTGVGKDSCMVESVKTRAWYISGFHLISWYDM